MCKQTLKHFIHYLFTVTFIIYLTLFWKSHQVSEIITGKSENVIWNVLTKAYYNVCGCKAVQDDKNSLSMDNGHLIMLPESNPLRSPSIMLAKLNTFKEGNWSYHNVVKIKVFEKYNGHIIDFVKIKCLEMDNGQDIIFWEGKDLRTVVMWQSTFKALTLEQCSSF